MGLGLDSQPDATLLREVVDPRSRNLRTVALATGTRVYPDHGALCMDEGTVEYSAVSHLPVGVHRHGSASKLLATASATGTYVDTPGDGSAWDLISTLVPTRKGVAGRDGATYLAESGEIPVRFTGGTSVTALPDIIRPEDGRIQYEPEPSDILIDDCNAYSGDWSATGAVTLADETALVRYGTAAMKLTFAGSATGERVDRDLGSGNEIDLSNSDFLAFWIFADTEGEYLIFKMFETADESDAHWISIPIDPSDVDKWKLVVWDLTGIPAAERDAIRYLRIGIPQTQACVVVIDQIAHSGGLFADYSYAVCYAKSTTGERGPIGEFRQVETVEGDQTTSVLPQRCVWIPAFTVYMPDTADRVNLYRTLGGGSDYYLIAELTTTQCAAGYTDNKPDAELTEDLRLTSWWGQVPRAKWLMARGDRLWYMGGEWCGARDETETSTKTGSVSSEVWVPHGIDQARISRIELSVHWGKRNDTVIVRIQTSPKGAADWTTVWSDTRVGLETVISDEWVSYVVAPTIAEGVFYRADLDWRINITVSGGTRIWHTGGARTRPPVANLVAYRVYFDIPNGIFMSELGRYEQVPPLGVADMPVDVTTGGYFELNPGDGQAMQDWCEHGSDVVILKERCGYLVVGTSMDDFEYILVLPSLGCGDVGEETLVDCDGLAVWLNQHNQVFAWHSGGDKPIYLSREIEDWLKSLTITSAKASYWKRRYYLTVVSGGTSYGRFYDFDEQAWSPCLPQAGNAIRFGPSQSSAVLYVNTGSSLVKYGSGYTDDGAAIDWAARGKALGAVEIMGDPARIIRLRAYRLLVDGPAAGTVTVEWYVDRGTSATRTYTETIPSGSGIREITRMPHSDIMGENLAVELSGAHSAAMKVYELQLWLQVAR